MEGSGEDAGAVGCGWCDCVYSDVAFDGIDGMDRKDVRVMARGNRLERARWFLKKGFFMDYKDFKKALKEIGAKYERERRALYDEIKKIEWMVEHSKISEKETFEKTQKLYGILDGLKGREKRSIERLKMNFANQDAPAKVGDLIWANTKQGTKLLKVTEIHIAAFDYPMLKYFGVQLTLKGVPSKIQKEYPNGGIYQKDVTSVNGEVYTYKVRE